MTMAPPLEGVRVLDLTHMLAGPYCTMLLADLGADVVKVESPERPDLARSMPGCRVGGETAYFACLNRNKRSVALDLKQAAGRAAFLRLAASADAVVDNFRPGVTDRLGISPRYLRELNPRLVTCSISGFGATGPRRDLPAYDYLIQALAGTMSLTGDPQGSPTKFGISIVDHTTGLMAAFAIVTALRAAERSGEGTHVDLALLDTHVSMLSYLAADLLNCGTEPQRFAASAHPYIVPSQLFATRDGHVVVMPMADHMWEKLCVALELDALGSDAELASSAGRLAQRDRVVEAVAARIGELDTDTVVERLTLAGVPAAPVNSVAAALAEPQLRARKMMVEAGRVHMIGNPVKMTEVEEPPYRRAPRLGEQSREILVEAGLSEEEVAELCTAS
jgi:crotonobetainyl-CoA:carnitine CoA-transferase CaiB-like acyl-CoA transferase